MIEKDIWTQCCDERNDLYFEQKRIQNVIEKIKTFVFPVAQILEIDDVPISHIWVTRYLSSITLKPEIFLTQDTLNKIKNKFDVEVTKYFLPDGSLRINLTRCSDGAHVDIDSTGPVCLVRPTVTTETIPEHIKETTTYEIVGPCEAWDVTGP